MKIIHQDAQGGATVELTQVELQALGAAIWCAKEEGTGQVYSRFFPEGTPPVPEDAFCDALYDFREPFEALGVDMG